MPRGPEFGGVGEEETKPTFYEVLGVSRTAEPAVIKAAWRRMARAHHPDVNPANRRVSEEKFKQISEAFSVLSDPQKRQAYDQKIGYVRYSPPPETRTQPPTPRQPVDPRWQHFRESGSYDAFRQEWERSRRATDAETQRIMREAREETERIMRESREQTERIMREARAETERLMQEFNARRNRRQNL